jgi:hypothetical protein
VRCVQEPTGLLLLYGSIRDKAVKIVINNNIKSLYNKERPISGVFGATVPEREICQFSDLPVDFAGYSATGCRVYSLSSPCLSYKGLLENLPAAGGRRSDTGAVELQGTNALYWASSSAADAKSGRFDFSSASPTINAGSRSYGASVRCVQEPTGLLLLYNALAAQQKKYHTLHKTCR